MKKCTKLFAIITAGLLVLGASATAFAVPNPGPDEKAANGDTTFGVMETNTNPGTVSFEVPLYVTMAAVAGQDTVQMPTDAYKITNTSKAANGTDPGYSIGVVGLSFETVAGGTWGTTLTATPTGATKEMNLTIGGVQMPALAANGHAQPTVDITSVDNTFYDHANSKPKPISADPNTPAVGNSLVIPLVGKISTTAVAADAAAAPQFKVKYTISAIGGGGGAIGQPYVGNDSNAAGFGDWTPDGFPTQTP